MKLKFVGANSAILLILIPAAAWGSDTANPKSDILSIEYRHERLKVVADNVPLSLAMLAIADKTGLEIHGIEFLKGNIKTSFSKLTLPLALKETLQSNNYLLQESTGRSNAHPVLTVLSYSPSNASQKTKTTKFDSFANTTQVPATAGYVPEQYRQLYGYAERGNFQALQHAINTGDPTTQTLATQLLAPKNPGLASELAAETIKSADPNRRLNAVQFLSELNSADSTDVLGTALRDPNFGVRNAAVLALHNQTSNNAVALLTGALQDEDPSIRSLALDLLAEKGTDGIVGIKEALASTDPQLKERAQVLLKHITPVE